MGMKASNGNIRMEKAPDGASLRIGCWQVAGDVSGTVILLHGRTEFLEKYLEVVGELNGRGFDVWSMDWRGQGLSDRMLEHPQKGHIDRFETYIGDLVWFVNEIVHTRRGPVILLAHSMGGHVGIRAVLETRIKPDGLVTTAPMIALPMGRLATMGSRIISNLAAGVGLGKRYGPGMSDHDPARVKFDNNPLTGDRERFNRFYGLLARNPGLALGGVTWGWLSAAFDSMAELQRLARDPAEVCPVLICTAMADRVLSVGAQSALSDAVQNWTQIRLDGARHEPMMETDAIRARFWAAFDDFLRTV